MDTADALFFVGDAPYLVTDVLWGACIGEFLMPGQMIFTAA
jgi:hypothetical protein